jgi:hypothetical protein
MNNLRISVFIMDQHLLIKTPLKPAGLGALSEGICLTILSISETRKGEVSSYKSTFSGTETKESRSKDMTTLLLVPILFLKEHQRRLALSS